MPEDNKVFIHDYLLETHLIVRSLFKTDENVDNRTSFFETRRCLVWEHDVAESKMVEQNSRFMIGIIAAAKLN